MSFTWHEIVSEELDDYVLTQNFLSGMKVLIERPHVINPKVLAAEVITTEDIPFVHAKLIEHLISGEFCEDSIKDILKNIPISEKPVIQNTEDSQACVLFRTVIPKRFSVFKEVFEVVILDYFEESVSFFPKKSDVLQSPVTPSFPYKFKLIEKRIQLSVLYCSEEKSSITTESEKWLAAKVLPKVSKWSQNVPKRPIVPSLQLVPAKNYSETLHYLKTKYAKKFVEIWPLHNNTDPIKYVYEDLSIAAYLITLWAEERKKLNLTKKQTFVDIGCGHGLLDHILQSEGHDGIGYDLRKRKIWSVYGDETKLIEMVIEPNDRQLYPDYDWIIGNHPDELTPWIPVIAARSSYKMRAFILPCCFYTFDGKYARNHHDHTQYQSYLKFIKTLCESMGFNTQFDKLRIPSTKRTCLVCTSRNYKEEEETSIDIMRTDFICSHSKYSDKSSQHVNDHAMAIPLDDINDPMEISHWAPTDANSSPTKWIRDFTPREAFESPRNCTTLDKNIIHEAVMTIVNVLLKTENYESIQRNDDTLLWNKGGVLKMKNLSDLLDQRLLKCMKNQRGGLQTLIRNHQNIFEVKNDSIQLRTPSINVPPKKEIDRKKNIRTKYEWKRDHQNICAISRPVQTQSN
ncbi:hypothetical protein JTE90_017960 [Oedothorax gibbosus]|uniref:tRNA (uracil-O(2)-)-methyltransferase n=1 Tax=Oedothorax gibbosus TaxID=931172 RepID=A0AAV6V6X9_9ARAC|nr:hypothetical protein JTE90_017960 [Oedothorax gibbosus]